MLLMMMTTLLQGTPWVEVDRVEGRVLAAHHVDETSFEELRVTHVVQYPARWVCDAVFAELTQKPHNKAVQSRKVLKQTESEVVFYDLVRASMVSDRDYAVRLEKVLAADGSCGIEWESANDQAPAPPEGCVRMPLVKGQWRFESIGPNETRIAYTTVSDPGGSIPAWVARSTARTMALEEVKAYEASFVPYAARHAPAP